MGGHDCPATRYLIMSDAMAFTMTVILLAGGLAVFILDYLRKWGLTPPKTRKDAEDPPITRDTTMSFYGSVEAFPREKTLALDRLGVNEKKKPLNKKRDSARNSSASDTTVTSEMARLKFSEYTLRSGLADTNEGNKDEKSIPKDSKNGTSYYQEKDGLTKPPLSGEKKKVKKPRIHFFDNCRWWLETFVILKHTLEFFPPGGLTRNTSWWMEGISNYFETFFMAMFVFCSGFLSKGEMNARRAKRYLFRVWIPFVLINFINRGVDKGWSHWLDNFPSFTNAYDTSWFLACVIQWRMLVTFFATMTPAGRMFVACILSWFSGYFFIATPTFHLAETLSFLPFYLAGHLVTREHVNYVKQNWIRRGAMIFSLGFFVAMMAFSYLTFSSEETVKYGIRDFEGQRQAMTIFTYSGYIKGWQRCHYFTSNNAANLTNYWLVWSHRVVYQLITWIMGLAFVLMIPHEKQFYTESGGYTMYPYLLQIFFFALERNFFRAVSGHGIVPATNLWAWALIILSIPFVNLMLSHYWCRKAWNIIFEPAWLDGLLFATPNKTISAFVGTDISSNDIQVTSTVESIIEHASRKMGIQEDKLVVYANGEFMGGKGEFGTLQEESNYQLSQVKSIHVEPWITSLFHSKRKVTVNAYTGYSTFDYLFSLVCVVATVVLISVTKLPVILPSRAPTPAPMSNSTIPHDILF